METIDQYVTRHLNEWAADPDAVTLRNSDDDVPTVADAELRALFDAQIQARHVDLALRWLQGQGEGFYTIGSSGHEGNAAVALALRPTDPALLHYRSGGFYAARASQVAGSTPIEDVLHSATCSIDDPISGGRHKVFGHPELAIIPQTSTISSHLPRAVGLAFALGRGLHDTRRWPADSVVVTSIGDASANHSTAVGALNAAGYCAHQGLRLPLLVVCEDNRIGISTRTPHGWTARSLQSYAGLEYVALDSTRPRELLAGAHRLVDVVRSGQPAILHLHTSRYMGHAGSDAELGYRTRAEITADYAADPVLATGAALVNRGIFTAAQLRDRYEAVRGKVMASARARVGNTRRLPDAAAVMRPLSQSSPDGVVDAAIRVAADRPGLFGGVLPEDTRALTLGQSLNAALRDAMAARPHSILFGEDVARKGGVYGITRGLQKAFGGARVFDTLLDEQTILGIALGSALAGALPLPEIQYLAYLHNAADQIRGEAASLQFFSAGQYRNGMVVRIAGLAYQKGFGGHFHNDNAVAALRDIPGIVVAVPSHPSTAPDLVRACLGLAEAEGRVCILLEPIALYHERHLLDEDDGWQSTYAAPGHWHPPGLGQVQVTIHADRPELTLVSFGNGLRMSMRVARRLAGRGAQVQVIDLRWIAPLPISGLLDQLRDSSAVLVVDETRDAAGVGEGVVSGLVAHGYHGRVVRVSSRDSYVPLGPAAAHVLLSEKQVEDAAAELLGHNLPVDH